MSQLVTRCPHCSTSFHVNEQQLRAARGAVRCGSCLQVFRADENIVFTESGPSAGKDLDALLEDDDFLIHDDIDLDGDSDPVPPTVPAETTASAAESIDPDEPLIGDAFGDSQWQDTANAAPAPEDDEDDDLSALAPDREDNPWAAESPEPPLQRESSLSARWDDESTNRAASGNEPTERLHQVDRPANASRRDTGASTATGEDPSREQLISAIEPAPLEVAWRPQRDRRVPGWLWTLLALLLALGLAAQFAYFHFDGLSKREPWRSLYARACPALGCTLPPLVDMQAIRTSNLVVRSHPQIEGALIVDAVLLNTASFAQPFPKLLLNFSDLKNKPVASRLFAPRDYLQGELAGRKQMPSGSPVHIGIEIVDPGSAAVNYELRIAQ